MGADKIKKEISKSMMYQAKHYLDNFEKEVFDISDMQGLYFNDFDFLSLATLHKIMGVHERVQTYRSVWDELNLIKNYSSKIHEIKIYIPGSEIILSSIGSQYHAGIDGDEVDAVTGAKTFPFSFWNGRLFLNQHSTMLYGSDRMPRATISVELSVSKIANSLHEFAQYEGGGAVLVNKEQRWMIFDNISLDTDTSNYAENRNVEGWTVFDKLKENNKNRIDVEKHIREKFDSGYFSKIDETIYTMEIGNEKFLTLYNKSDYLDSALFVYIPESKILGPIELHQKWMWVVSILALLEIFIFSYLIYNLIKKPLSKLLLAFKKVDEGVLDISIGHKSNDEFRYIYGKFNNMIEKLKGLIKQMYEQSLLTKSAELKQLQNQINSHFLYNSFFIISRLVEMQDTENAARLTHHLALYYQFITRSSTDDIELLKEVNHARSYIEIQDFRFSKQISSKFEELCEELMNIRVPRLILQPLIENCYKHGLKNKNSGGLIHVSIKHDTDYIYITVEDNGEELSEELLEKLRRMTIKKEEKDEDNTGLLNIHRRIQMKYGEDCGLFFSRSEYGGLCATIRIYAKL